MIVNTLRTESSGECLSLKPDCCWILYRKQGIILDYNSEENRRPCACKGETGTGILGDGGAQ